MFSTFAVADDQKAAIALAKKHMVAFITADAKTLKTTMTEFVQLMPGHEFTKEKYKLAGKDGRSTGALVKRDELLKVLLAKMGERAKPLLKEVEARIVTLKFTVIASKEGEVITDSADRVMTKDGKLHFNLKKGDLLIKGAPERGDFVLFQLRKVGTDWKVVAEYLD